MSKKPRILLINDDGIAAEGLKHLWRALIPHAELLIVAPATEQSGKGVSITLHTPLHLEPVTWEKDTKAWKVNGTPSDCVRLALSILTKDAPPDLIVSGINHGANSGRNVLHSGTIGGVIDGMLRNIPGIAFSCEDFFDPLFEVAGPYIYPIVRYTLEHPLPRGTFLNVNFPHAKSIKGLQLARQGKGFWVEDPDGRVSPDGKPYYWLGGKWLHVDEEKDSDVALLQQGWATAVPVQIQELTDETYLGERKQLFESFISPI